MRKFEKNIIKNVSSNWFSLGVNVAVGLLLTPFILHRLGDTANGIWVLIFSVTGYYGLFDLGIRSSLVRYVSKFTATGEREELAKLVNTSLFTYTCIGVLSLIVTLGVAAEMDHIFKIQPEFHSTARWLLIMVGGAVALGFPMGIFGGFLDGLQRFYVNSLTNVVSTVLRAVLIVLALVHGYGLLMIAAITVSLGIVASMVRGCFALYYCPVPFGFRYVERGTFRQIANYSVVTFMIMVAGRLKFKTDELVIGTMMSAAAITYFSIGGRIVDYAGQVVTALSQIFVPMASQSDAKGDINALRKLFFIGNRVCALTIFPLCVILLILGKSIIEVWVGKRYVAASYPVLVIMIVCCTLWWAQGASGRILFGMSKHGSWAIVTMMEGVANLVLSIVMVRPWGIVGDALGTAIPLGLSTLFFMPRHLCRHLNVRVRTFIREAYALPFLLCIPLAASLLLMRYWFIPHKYWQLGIQLAIAAAVYGASLLWAVWTKRALRIRDFGIIESATTAEIAVAAPAEVYQQDI